MRCLRRNKTPFWYALFREKERVKGGHRPIYEDAVRMTGNISPAKGAAYAEPFGSDLQYDRVIVLDDPKCPIDENTILFIDVEPSRNTDGDYIYDYVVKKVARSLNSVSIAVSRVSVS